MTTPIRSNTFYALDFDRCLGDVPALVERLARVIDQLGYVSHDELIGMRDATEASGGSFDAVAYLRDKAGSDAVAHVLDSYAAASAIDSEAFLMPGAQQLLSWLDEAGHPYGIMTFGSEDWQLAKIRLAGLGGIATYVTDTPRKGRRIIDWFNDTRCCYVLPSVYKIEHAIESVVLVDDKADAFNGLESIPGARGYWVQPNDGVVLLSQQGRVPRNVITVQSLHEIVRSEQKILT